MKPSKDEQLITVITLSYRSTHLMEAIDSVLSQRYPSIQYIIADDGSEQFDENALYSYIDEHQRGNIKEVLVLHQPTNVGTVQNYNRALVQAKGTYIFPLSGDDVYENSYVLSRWVKGFKELGDPVVCTCCSVYDESLKHFRGRWPRPQHIRLMRSRNWDEIYQTLETNKILPGCTMARTKESIETLGLFDTGYRLLEDYPFIMRVLRNHVPIGFISRSMVKKRSGGVSDSAKMNPQLKNDMNRFYEEEVFPYCNSKEELENIVRKQNTIMEKTAGLIDIWEKGTASQKYQLFLQHPGFVFKRIIRTMIRI